MITRRQLEEIARKSRIGLYYQEKDYLLNVFLYFLYRETKDFVFKGGTCLKLAYNYPRFSEDLDFNTKLKPEQIQQTVKRALSGFSLLGIEHEIEKEELFDESFSIKIKLKGPLFSGREETKNTIRIDAGLRGGTVLEPVWKQAISPYADVPNFILLCMQEEEILAEKVRALLSRGKPRDIFDVWLMMKKIRLNKDLMKRKLSKIKLRKPEESFPSKREYENDLKNLVDIMPDYGQVLKDIKKALAEAGLGKKI